MPLRSPRAPRLRRVRQAIARPWRIWLADNLLRGVPPAELQATLIKHEVPPQLAARGLRAAACSPELEAELPAGRLAIPLAAAGVRGAVARPPAMPAVPCAGEVRVPVADLSSCSPGEPAALAARSRAPPLLG